MAPRRSGSTAAGSAPCSSAISSTPQARVATRDGDRDFCQTAADDGPGLVRHDGRRICGRALECGTQDAEVTRELDQLEVGAGHGPRDESVASELEQRDREMLPVVPDGASRIGQHGIGPGG